MANSAGTDQIAPELGLHYLQWLSVRKPNIIQKRTESVLTGMEHFDE